MNYVFNKTATGYSHLKSNKCCQDFSSSYKDPLRTIITCCDGHGGEIYIRSNRGSEFASHALVQTLGKLTPSMLRKNNLAKVENIIKLSVLCDWNAMVEDDLSEHHLSKKELTALSAKDAKILKADPTVAYGTTLSGAAIINNKVVVVNLGDTEAFGVKRGKVFPIFDDEDEPVANFTYSLCQSDAYKHLKVKILDLKDVDGIFLCTDGLSAPYQTYESFDNNCIKLIVRKLINTHNMFYIEQLVDDMASKLGTGDDVSLSFILKNDVKLCHYTTNERKVI